MSGFIKLFRKLQSWQWYGDSKMVHLFIHLLLEANHEDRMWKGQKVSRGQLIFGRKSFSETLGISEKSIRTCMERLKSTNEVAIQSTNRFSLVTIVNWEFYQGDENKRPAKRPANGQTNGQQTATPKEYKEDKNNIITRFQRFIDFVNSTFSKNFRYQNKKALSSFKQRIEIDKYHPEEIKKVILALKDSSYHIESEYKYCTPEFILRIDKIEKYKHGAIIDKVIRIDSGNPKPKQQYDQETDLYADFQS